MKKLFWSDPYLSEVDATVTSVEGELVQVDRSIFFAESGGQESDHGCFDDIPVEQAQCCGPNILYRLPPTHGLQIGQQVCIKIDWPRRYRLMRLHFAAEVILELCYRELAGIEKIGAHIAEDKARIDFLWPQPITQHFIELKQAAAKLIDSNLPILSDFSDREMQRRYWEVEGFARVPCGGTHLKSTAEVGGLKLRRKNIGRGKERIEIMLLD